VRALSKQSSEMNLKAILIITSSLLLITCSDDKQVVDHTKHVHNMNEANMAKEGAASNDLILTDSQIKLANITTQIVTNKPIGQTAIVNGRLVENKNLSEVISSRGAGRIQKLYVKETGRTIKKGQPLYELYSETLLTLQKEYLLAKEQYETLGASENRYKPFLDASRQKLILYGLKSEQIDELGKRKIIQNTITFLSPTSGIVTEITVAEGQYVSEGSSLMKVADVNTVWLEADLYPSEISFAKAGDKINVKVNGFENNNIDATINFLSPEYRNNSQIIILRATLPNKDLVLKPGMLARVFFTHSKKIALTLPMDAIIRDGQGTHVYVQQGWNTFRPSMVKTGIEDSQNVEIIQGIVEGDTVVITGAYLLYSENILKKGSSSMAGHIH
jgi:membrane fusion protein, copper/silver efflux system